MSKAIRTGLSAGLLVAGLWAELAASASAATGPAAPVVKAAAIPAPPAARAPIAVPAIVAARPQGYADLVDRLLPMVVKIETTQTLKRTAENNDEGVPQAPPGSDLDDFFKNFMDRNNRPRRVQSLGSGFIIDPAGYIATNNHVIDGADEITVELSDGTSLPATLVGTDDKTDLALLKVNTKQPLAVAKFGDSDKARVGDLVLAIGEPFGVGMTVTSGIVSARSRDISSGDYDDFLQTDAPINRGNSGGPLFNMDGEVIGINSEIYSPNGGSIGLGFSIPSNVARNILYQLKTTGKIARGMIGVNIQEVTQEIADSLGLDKPRGALIAGITPGGPAAKAGIQSGDVVLSFNSKPIVEARNLPLLVADAPIGKAATVEVLRKGQHKIIPVTVLKLLDAPKTANAGGTKPGAKTPGAAKPPQIANLGLTLAPVTPDARRQYHLDAKLEGVVVTDVDPDSPAGQKNIRPGDVITEVQQDKVLTPDEVAAKIDAEKKAGHKVVLLAISREGELTFIGVRLP